MTRGNRQIGSARAGGPPLRCISAAVTKRRNRTKMSQCPRTCTNARAFKKDSVRARTRPSRRASLPVGIRLANLSASPAALQVTAAPATTAVPVMATVTATAAMAAVFTAASTEMVTVMVTVMVTAIFTVMVTAAVTVTVGDGHGNGHGDGHGSSDAAVTAAIPAAVAGGPDAHLGDGGEQLRPPRLPRRACARVGRGDLYRRRSRRCLRVLTQNY